MSESRVREEIARLGRSMFERRLTFGSTGNISVRVDDGRGRRVRHAAGDDVFTLGGWVRTQDFDTGLSLGYHSTSFVFPGVEGQTPSQEWRFFSIPLPDGVPYCQASTRVGTSIDLANPQTGFNLGFLRELWRIGPGFGESVEVRFHFDRANPEATLLEVRRGL